MERQPPYGYYYGNEAGQYTFYRIPKALFTDDRYKCLSDGAKILYGLMLDRMGLSVKNGWLDGQDRVYIYFTLDDVQEYMNCKHDKAVKMFAELDTEKGVGLIERVRQGQGRPAIIYVRKFFDEAEVLTSEKPKSGPPDLPQSRLRENRSQDFGFSDASKNDINNTDLSDTDHPSIRPAAREPEPPDDGIDRMDGHSETEIYREIIKDNIDYDILCTAYGPEQVTEILELILEPVCGCRGMIRVGGGDFPAEAVKSRFLKLGMCHIQYVLDCLRKNTTKIHNIKSYLLTALYNAPATINSYYTAEVNHDFYYKRE